MATAEGLIELSRPRMLQGVGDLLATMRNMAETAKNFVPLPAELTEEVRTIAGENGVVAYVEGAVDHQVAMDKLGMYIDNYETLNGPIPDEAVEAARAELWGSNQETGA